MKEFKKPEVEIIELVDDVITSSICTANECPLKCPDDCITNCVDKCQVV